MNAFFNNVVRIWNWFWGMILNLLQVIGQYLVTALGWVALWGGRVLALLALLLIWILIGALVEEWFQWGWRNRRRVWPALTLIVWLPATIAAIALLGAMPLTLGWVPNVTWAFWVGVGMLMVSIVVNLVAEPLRVFKPIGNGLRRILPRRQVT